MSYANLPEPIRRIAEERIATALERIADNLDRRYPKPKPYDPDNPPGPPPPPPIILEPDTDTRGG